MPTLNWIGKDKVVNHHAQVPFRVLDHQYGYDSNNPELKDPTKSGNKIIHGENLKAKDRARDLEKQLQETLAKGGSNMWTIIAIIAILTSVILLILLL